MTNKGLLFSGCFCTWCDLNRNRIYKIRMTSGSQQNSLFLLHWLADQPEVLNPVLSLPFLTPGGRLAGRQGRKATVPLVSAEPISGWLRGAGCAIKLPFMSAHPGGAHVWPLIWRLLPGRLSRGRWNAACLIRRQMPYFAEFVFTAQWEVCVGGWEGWNTGWVVSISSNLCWGCESSVKTNFLVFSVSLSLFFSVHCCLYEQSLKSSMCVCVCVRQKHERAP